MTADGTPAVPDTEAAAIVDGVMAGLRVELTGWRRAIEPAALASMAETFPVVVESAVRAALARDVPAPGRDLTAQDVRDAVEQGARRGAHLGPQVIADVLNEIARGDVPVDTAGQDEPTAARTEPPPVAAAEARMREVLAGVARGEISVDDAVTGTIVQGDPVPAVDTAAPDPLTWPGVASAPGTSDRIETEVNRLWPQHRELLPGPHRGDAALIELAVHVTISMLQRDPAIADPS